MKTSEKRIETTTSRTAEMTCLSRAVSSLESNAYYKSGDYLAVRLLPRFFMWIIHIPWARTIFNHAIAPHGMYEYVIARTKFIDEIFQTALAGGIEQVLILGAGFDTRALRFADTAGRAMIFELDVAITQQAKIRQYEKRGLRIPSNLIFLPVDFEKEKASDKLREAGFDRGKRSLFLLEGLLMYLQPESAAETFRTIRDFSTPGSEIVFDCIYASVLRREGRYEGEKRIVETVSQAGEQWHFGVEEGEMEQRLAEYDFKLCDQRNARQLEQMYFTDASGRIVGRVNGTHCLFRAVRV